jgi:uncharacterized protein involved in cysteine biosynthesis
LTEVFERAEFCDKADVCLDRLAASMMPIGPAWLTWLLSIVVAVVLLAGVILLVPPTASLVAGFYLDEVTAAVEREIAFMCAPGVLPPAAAALEMYPVPVFSGAG